MGNGYISVDLTSAEPDQKAISSGDKAEADELSPVSKNSQVNFWNIMSSAT